MSEVTLDDVENIMATFYRRCEAARAVGGIPYKEVVEKGLCDPVGYYFDEQTCYFIPDGIELF